MTVSALSSVVAVVAGQYFSFALTQSGTVYTWGGNGNGQLGLGHTTSQTTPVLVSALTGVTALAANNAFALALKADGTVLAWGWNYYGQLGDGTTTQRTAPVSVLGVSGATAIAAGGVHGMALRGDGTVLAWGSNLNGQLADTDPAVLQRTTAAAVPGLSGVIRIAAGMSHVLVLRTDDEAWAWGRNVDGQLGTSTTSESSAPVTTPEQISGPYLDWKVWTPLLSVSPGVYLTEQTVTVTCADPGWVAAPALHYTITGTDPTESDAALACGGTVAVNQSLALKIRGWRTGAPASEIAMGGYTLKAVTPAIAPGTGSYASAQQVTVSTSTSGASITYTLDGTEPTSTSTAYSAPVSVASTVTLKARAYRTGWTPSDSAAASYWISAGSAAAPTITPAAGTFTDAPLITLATVTTGATIRYTLDGSEPGGASPVYAYPFLVPVTTTVKAKAFKTGLSPSTTTTATYQVDAAGATVTPTLSLGGGRFTTRQTVTVTGPGGATLRYTTTGVDPTDTDTTIASGATVTIDRSLVLKVRAWQSGLTPSAVRRADFLITGALAAGLNHSLALKSDRTLWAWGMNANGQLGDGTTTYRATPVQVLTDVIAIAAGPDFTLAIKADATVWSWGSNGYGQLGTGNTFGRSTPGLVPGLSGAVAVAAGDRHALAVATDGRVYAWGWNDAGQLGDGTTTQRLSAGLVSGVSGAARVAAGDSTSFALTTDGAATGLVWAWGRNTDGQLGDGSGLARTMPVQVPGVAAVSAVAASRSWAGVVTADGQGLAWGSNAERQLGNGTTLTSVTPHPVSTVTTFHAMGAGVHHGAATSRDGRYWAWGQGGYGQSGDGTYENSAIPRYVPAAGTPVVVALGGSHTLVVKINGSVWATGQNNWGQLGQGTTTGASTFVASSALVLADNAWLMSDTDGDGLSAWREYVLGTDPLNADTNGDGLPDGIDGGDPSAANLDRDGDGLSNAVEQVKGTDPYRVDTDGDGVHDGSDAFPLDPTRSQLPPPDPMDTTPPVITLIESTSARPVP